MFVCIATYNPGNNIEKILEALEKCNKPDDYKGTWIIENGSERPTFNISGGGSTLNLNHIFINQTGQARARQWFVEFIKEGLIVFLDDDVIPDYNFLMAYSRESKRWGRGYYFGGPWRVEYEEPPSEIVIDYLPFSVKGWCPRASEFSFAKRGWAFLGGNFAAFAEDIYETGGFEVQLGPGAFSEGTYGGKSVNPTGHEKYLQERLFQSGCRPIYIFDASVFHIPPSSNVTAKWVLRRKFRDGKSKGILEGWKTRGRVPRWMWRRYIELVVLIVFYVFLFNRKKIMEKAVKIQFVRGQIAGIRFKKIGPS